MKAIGGRLRQRIEDFKVEEVPKPLPEGDDYTVFWMEKFNWDTNGAIRMLARSLKVSIKRFGIAGTKDKRAVTKQRVSVWNIEPDALEKVRIRDIRLYDFEKSGERINLGDSEGNRFTVIIRDIDLDKEETRKRLEETFSEMEKGILNRFGPQRFGEVRTITHLVGKEMLKSNFEGAVRIYLAKVFEKEPDDAKEARSALDSAWGTKEGYLKALEMFPKRLKYERSMLDYLSKNPNDFAGALRRVSKRLRKMFVNAFQSWIFNQVAEEGEDAVKLPGYDTELGNSSSDKKIKEILEKEGIRLEDFRMRSMPELACTGSERKVMLVPKDLNIIEIADDDFNEGKRKATISFALPSGAYATVVLSKVISGQ